MENQQQPAPTDGELVDAFEFAIREGEDLKGDSSRVIDAGVAILARLASLALERDGARKDLEELGFEMFEVEKKLVAVKVERDALRKAAQLGLDAINASLSAHVSVTYLEIIVIRDSIAAALALPAPTTEGETANHNKEKK